MQLFTRLPTALAILGVSTLAGLGAYVWQQPTGITPTAPTLEIPSLEAVDEPAIDAVTHEEPITPHVVPANAAIPFAFTMTVGGVTYVVMPNDNGVAAPTRARLVVDEGVTSAIAPLARTTLPAPLRAWFGRTFVVGERCRARVDGFAYVSRLTGDPAYAGLEAETWSTRDVLAHGQHAIVARLDHVCAGEVARDATLAPMPTATVVEDPALLAEARAALFASDVAKDADVQWNDADAWGDAPTKSWRVEAEVDARVIVHGATHEKWVIVHAHVGGGCGMRSANVLGIYRQTTAGALQRVYQSNTGGIDHIDRLLDVDGDGRFEILSSSWMGPELELRTLDDASLDQRTVPFFGCPC